MIQGGDPTATGKVPSRHNLILPAQCVDPLGCSRMDHTGGGFYLRLQVCGRDAPRAQAHRGWDPLDGKLWAKHKRIPVLHHACPHPLARRQAHHLRPHRLGNAGGNISSITQAHTAWPMHACARSRSGTWRGKRGEGRERESVESRLARTVMPTCFPGSQTHSVGTVPTTRHYQTKWRCFDILWWTTRQVVKRLGQVATDSNDRPLDAVTIHRGGVVKDHP